MDPSNQHVGLIISLCYLVLPFQLLLPIDVLGHCPLPGRNEAQNLVVLPCWKDVDGRLIFCDRKIVSDLPGFNLNQTPSMCLEIIPACT